MGLLDRLSLWLGGGRREVRVAVLGLDNSGKSSILRALRPTTAQAIPADPILPTVGVNQDNFQSGGVHFSAWDVGGSRRHRALWERHYRGSDAIVYVVDAADHLRLVVSREELWLVLSHPDVSGRRLPVLVLANKSDRPDALPPAHIAGALGLDRITDKSWHICATSATSGAGLQDGVAWLAGQLRQ